MDTTRLILRGAAYHRRILTAVSAAVAVSAMIVTGALLVGESVRGSVRHVTLARLGRVDVVITGRATFPVSFAQRVAEQLARSGVRAAAAAAILTPGAAASGVNEEQAVPIHVVGVADDAGVPLGWKAGRGEGEDWCDASAALTDALVVRPRDDMVVTVARSVSGDGLFSRRRRTEALSSMRVTLGSRLPDLGLGGFSLRGGTIPVRSVFVSRTALARAVGEEDRANTVLLRGERSELTAPQVAAAIDAVISADDLGIRVSCPPGAGFLVVSSRSTTIPPPVRRAAEAVRELGRPVPTSVYLASRVAVTRSGGPSISYAVAAYAPSVRHTVRSGRATPRDAEAVLVEWAATDLQARVGDRLNIEYMTPSDDGTYPLRALSVRVAGIVSDPTAASGAALVPDFRGITDADRVGDWNPPFPVDMRRVTRRDDEYWTRHRAAPKVFLAESALQEMWTRADGRALEPITSVRIPLPPGAPPEGAASAVRDRIVRQIRPSEAGMRVTAVRADAVAASSGSTDFTSLFLGLGAFVVASSMWLAYSLLRLTVEQRMTEAGLMVALGFAEKTVRRIIALEGVLASALGSAAGSLLGVGFASILVSLLNSTWSGAVGGAPIRLYVQPAQIAAGAVSALMMAFVAVSVSTRVLVRTPVLDLLHERRTRSGGRSARSWRRLAAIVACLGGAASAAVAGGMGIVASAPAFLACGALGLVGALGALNEVLERQRSAASRVRASLSTWDFVIACASFRRRQSVLTAGLMASASFIIVTVAANVKAPADLDTRVRTSGGGGFPLVMATPMPMPLDPSTPAGRSALGFSEEDEPVLAGTHIVPFLRSPGEDASCLNLAKPGEPQVLGVLNPDALRGRFTLRTVGPGAPAWDALRGPARGVPLFGDSETVQWILHSSLGGRTEVVGAGGRVGGVFTGLVVKSVFAGQLLTSAERFRALYPAVEGPSFFLIDTPRGRERAVSAALTRGMGGLGAEVASTSSVLNRLAAVQNTYLAAFMALGTLGMLLGTLGTGLAMVRGALERRREFGLLLALGLSRSAVVAVLLVEYAGLAVGGLILGVAAAATAFGPRLFGQGIGANWASVAVLVGVLAFTTLVACFMGARAATRGDLLQALRSE